MMPTVVSGLAPLVGTRQAALTSLLDQSRVPKGRSYVPALCTSGASSAVCEKFSLSAESVVTAFSGTVSVGTSSLFPSPSPTTFAMAAPPAARMPAAPTAAAPYRKRRRVSSVPPSGGRAPFAVSPPNAPSPNPEPRLTGAFPPTRCSLTDRRRAVACESGVCPCERARTDPAERGRAEDECKGRREGTRLLSFGIASMVEHTRLTARTRTLFVRRAFVLHKRACCSACLRTGCSVRSRTCAHVALRVQRPLLVHRLTYASTSIVSFHRQGAAPLRSIATINPETLAHRTPCISHGAARRHKLKRSGADYEQRNSTHLAGRRREGYSRRCCGLPRT